MYKDHNRANIIGNTKNGSVILRDTSAGLEFECKLPDTTAGRDTYELVRGGYSLGASIGGKVSKDGDKWYREGGEVRREIHDLDLDHIAIVDKPAYDNAEVEARTANTNYSLYDAIIRFVKKNQVNL